MHSIWKYVLLCCHLFVISATTTWQVIAACCGRTINAQAVTATIDRWGSKKTTPDGYVANHTCGTFFSKLLVFRIVISKHYSSHISFFCDRTRFPVGSAEQNELYNNVFASEKRIQKMGIITAEQIHIKRNKYPYIQQQKGVKQILKRTRTYTMGVTTYVTRRKSNEVQRLII